EQRPAVAPARLVFAQARLQKDERFACAASGEDVGGSAVCLRRRLHPDSSRAVGGGKDRDTENLARASRRSIVSGRLDRIGVRPRFGGSPSASSSRDGVGIPCTPVDANAECGGI